MSLTYIMNQEMNKKYDNDTLLFEGRENGRYQVLSSVELIFETVHPNDAMQNFIVSHFTPVSSSNMVFNREEASRKIYTRGLHHHDYFEMLYIIHGEMYQIIENKRHLYTEGSLCLLNKNIRHSEEFSSDFRAAFLSLPAPLIDNILKDSEHLFFEQEKLPDDQLLFTFFQNNIADNASSVREYIDFIPCSDDKAVRQKMYALFEELTLIFIKPSFGASYQIKYILMQIFAEILDDSHYQTLPVNIGTEKEGQIFDQITELMRLNNGRISRKELADTLHYSGAYLNNIVQKYTGLSLFQYAMTICMKEAAWRLLNTEEKISSIAESLGFNNRTHFYKVFKDAYHMTPKEYRHDAYKRCNPI